MKTNEQSNEQQLKTSREALILKGIATNILEMQYPQMKNLKLMLSYFDYDISPMTKSTTEESKDSNFVTDFYYKNKNIRIAIDQFNYDVSKLTEEGQLNSVYDGLLKKITLCENVISHYINESNLTEEVDFDKEHYKFYEMIDFLSKNRFILTPSLPIFKYMGVTYSVNENKFKNKLEFMNYFNDINEIIFVYFFKIYKDDSIIVRDKIINKKND